LGFSIGGVAAGDVAWRNQQVGAVVLVANDPDVRTGIESDFGKRGQLSILPALEVIRRAGIDLEAGHWAQILPALAPRGLLYVVGKRELENPLVRRMLAEARAAGAETYEVDGAGHGLYAEVAPVAYPEKVADFFARRLLAAR
jgi:pimeloyl-ACP methyl ester carboxylesterase